MSDPASRGLPDVALLVRLANEMFRAVPLGGTPGGIPVAAARPLGGFGAALPSAPLPEPPAQFGAPLPPLVLPDFAPLDFAVPGGTSGGPAASPNRFDAPHVPAPRPWSSYQRANGLSPPPAPSGTPLPGGANGIPAALAGSPGGFGAELPSAPLPEIATFGSGFPGEDELHALLTRAAPPNVPPIDAAPSYYFLHGTPSVPASAAAVMASSDGFDVNLVRRDFPILRERVNGRPLIWLDNAATTQKPQAVIDRLSYFYEHENSNIHRAAHELAARATDAYEKARDIVSRFVNASSPDQIVFVRGTTEAINLVSNTWGRRFIGKGDEIVITWLEHHANIVPWQMLCEQTGAILKVAPVDDSGQVLLNEYGRLLGPRTRLVSFTHVSNALGTVTPARAMIEMAHAAGARVLLDGAQSVSHMRTDVQSLDADWFVFSGHKVFGPTGIGALYGKPEVLAEMPPWQGGGGMIADVTFERTLYQPPPGLFEAGTGNIADAVGLGEALEYVERVGIETIGRHEHDLLAHATRLLRDIPGLRLLGTAADKAGVLSFVLDGVPTEAVGSALNREGIAVRAGHHCAQPILRRFGVEMSVRPSLALYNTHAEIDCLAAAVRRIQSGKVRSD